MATKIRDIGLIEMYQISNIDGKLLYSNYTCANSNHVLIDVNRSIVCNKIDIQHVVIKITSWNFISHFHPATIYPKPGPRSPLGSIIVSFCIMGVFI